LAEIEFAYSTYEGRITLLEPLIGKSGWLTVHLFSVESLDQAEDYVLCAAATDEGQALDDAVAARLLTLPGKSSPLPLGDTPNECPLPLGDTPNYSPLPMGEGRGEGAMRAVLSAIIEQRQASIQRGISERNARFFEAEAEKLDGWADDLKLGLEREIKELDRQIKEARRAATTALTLEEKLAGQKRIKALESQRNEKRRSLFDAQDEVDRQRDSLIASIEGKLAQRITSAALFSARWELR
jgi:adenine-specific DNA-methyltransferase